MKPSTHDLIIIGGGRASDLASAAAKAGRNCVLIERAALGGACPNHGCVPSKLLVGFAEAARHVRHADRHFVDASLHHVDRQAIFASINHYIDGVDGRYQSRIEDAGVHLVRGEGRFTAPRVVTAAGRAFTAPAIVVATGSRPAPRPFPELPTWTSDDVFPLRHDPPSSLLIVGGGVIGCELAAAFASLGTETHLFHRSPRLLPREDAEIESIFREEFTRHVPTTAKASLVDLRHDGKEFHATFEIDGERRLSHRAERVLFAIGRVPNSDRLDLENAGIETDERGFIQVDDHLRSTCEGVFATGDVNGRFMLQHAAAQEVLYLRGKLLKDESDPIDESLIGHGIFSHPELAAVGKTEEQVREAGTPHVSVCVDWLASARTMGMRVEYPRVKLIVSTEDHSILGCHLVGPEASTLIHQVMTVMMLKNDVRELTKLVHIHPALNECLLEAGVRAISAVRKAAKNGS